MKRLFPLALFLAVATGQAIAAGAHTPHPHAKRAFAIQRQPSDAEGVDWIASYEPGPLPHAYRAETACSAPPDDPYVIEHDGDKGLVFLEGEHDRRVKQYIVQGARIRAIVHVKYDMTVLDRADLVFTDWPGDNLILVRTTADNAGIFVTSDVYPLAYRHGAVLDSRRLIKDSALTEMVRMGISLYREAGLAARSPR